MNIWKQKKNCTPFEWLLISNNSRLSVCCCLLNALANTEYVWCAVRVSFNQPNRDTQYKQKIRSEKKNRNSNNLLPSMDGTGHLKQKRDSWIHVNGWNLIHSTRYKHFVSLQFFNHVTSRSFWISWHIRWTQTNLYRVCWCNKNNNTNATNVSQMISWISYKQILMMNGLLQTINLSIFSVSIQKEKIPLILCKNQHFDHSLIDVYVVLNRWRCMQSK